MGGFGYEWEPYVPVAVRKARAQKVLAKRGVVASPVRIEGRKITRTFWGQSWCDNLEAYSDYANRMPRGRTYVRNGSVVDLTIGDRVIHAKVSGTQLYTVKVEIGALPSARWKGIKAECAGKIDSLVELLGGRLSEAVMTVMTRRPGGLFPAPAEITLACSCPDVARMCKHVAATLYGVGSRLDTVPDLLFRLRGLDPLELVSSAGSAALVRKSDDGALAGADLAGIFGIEIDDGEAAAPPAAPKRAAKAPKRTTLIHEPMRHRARDLVALGIPHSMLQRWLKTGVLLATETRGEYLDTPATQRAMEAYLTRSTKAPRR